MRLIKSYLVLLILGLPFIGHSQSTLAISIEGIKEAKGELFIGLYTSKSTFQNVDSVFMEKIIPIDSTYMSTRFDSLHNGLYALTMFQDKNSNGKLDTGLFGKPKEKYGFSNNPKILFKAPGFDKCMFIVARDTTIFIKMK